MRAYSFLFTFDVPEVLFSFKQITAHLTTLSTYRIKQDAAEKHYPQYGCDSGDRVVFEKLDASTNHHQDQEQAAYDWIILLCHQTIVM
jgi:hypothetical protein